MNKTAVFYIADQQRYVNEAMISSASVTEKNEEVDTILFTPLDVLPKTFTQVIRVAPRFSDIFYYDHAVWMTVAVTTLRDMGYERAVFMDCDTYVCENINHVLNMLEHFDMMGVHAPGRETTRTISGLSTSFPEINLGFNPFNLSPVVINFFKDFVSIYANNLEVYGSNDQGAFRDTLYRYLTKPSLACQFRFHTLPVEYNCRFNFPTAVCKTVIVLHGHANDIARVGERINSEKGMRSWRSGEMSA